MLPSTDPTRQRFFEAPSAGVFADANAAAEAGSLATGEVQRLMLKIDPRTETIEDARAQTFGCSAAIAVASAVTELVLGRTVRQAEAIAPSDIVALLGNLSPEGSRSAVLGREALAGALAAWRGAPVQRSDPEPGALVCRCRAVRAGTIRQAIRTHGLATFADVTRHTGAGGQCTCCREMIEELLAASTARTAAPIADTKASTRASGSGRHAFVHPALARKRAPQPATVQPASAVADQSPGVARSTVQEAILIARLLERARPRVKADGGDVELVDYADGTVFVRLAGVCAGCSAASLTLGGLRQKIVQALGHPVRVVPVARS